MLLLLAGCGVEVNLRGLNKLGVGPTKQRNTPQIKHAPHVAIPVHHTSHLLNTPPTFHGPLSPRPGRPVVRGRAQNDTGECGGPATRV